MKLRLPYYLSLAFGTLFGFLVIVAIVSAAALKQAKDESHTAIESAMQRLDSRVATLQRMSGVVDSLGVQTSRSLSAKPGAELSGDIEALGLPNYHFS